MALDNALRVVGHKRDEILIEDSDDEKKHKKRKKQKKPKRVIVSHECKVNAFNLHNMENFLNKLVVDKIDIGI